MSQHPRRVSLTRRAEKELKRLDANNQRRVLAALDRLADADPSLDIKRLTGTEQSRVRVGELRVIFQTGPQASEIVVHRIAPRGRAYRP